MNARKFIQAFNDGKTLVNGDLVIRKGESFKMENVFSTHVNHVEETEYDYLVFISYSEDPRVHGIVIVTDNWEVIG